MFNPLSSTSLLIRARQSPSVSLSSRRFTLSNLTVIDASSRFRALRRRFLYKMTFSVSFSRIARCRPLRCFAPSLAATSRIIAPPPFTVNPFFAVFRAFNILRGFPSKVVLFRATKPAKSAESVGFPARRLPNRPSDRNPQPATWASFPSRPVGRGRKKSLFDTKFHPDFSHWRRVRRWWRRQ